MSKHALLSPSGASRWLACTPSARLEEPFGSSTNAAAEEGTLAHELCELYLRNHLKMIPSAKYKTELKKIKNNKYYNAEMDGHAVDYVDAMTEKYHALIEPTIFIEEKIDLAGYVPMGFGTVDCIMIGEGILDVNDFKYGKGVLVEAQENKQMMLYALGALKKYSLMYNIDEVRMSIWQPRLQNYSSYSLSAGQLEAWGKSYVKPRARAAFDGVGERVPGEHCRFCKVRNRCKALANQQLEIARHQFADVENLSDEDIADILEKAPTFKTWLSSIESYALNEAVTNGKQWPRHKLVRGRSNRKYADPTKIEAAFKKARIKKALYLTPPKLVGIGALEKNLGKEKVQKLAGKFIIKPEGAPTLVPEWDKRDAISSAEDAANAFKDVN